GLEIVYQDIVDTFVTIVESYFLTLGLSVQEIIPYSANFDMVFVPSSMHYKNVIINFKAGF
ncbi:MAG: hypothetical protein SPK27_02220, partial [Sodaliphilus sp.]|nr:hypothetical protein [Bacteroidales bacterium]MDY5866987.1 hypothetical protein [Sodaliphilus sp.]